MATATATIGTTKWLTFYLGHQLYALNVLFVREIIKRPALQGSVFAHSAKLSGRGAQGVEGLIAYRGSAVTVTNGLTRMGIDGEAETGMLIVLSVNDQRAAFSVTRMGAVKNYRPDDFQTVQTATDPAVVGVIRDGDDLVIGVSAEQLLNELCP